MRMRPEPKKLAAICALTACTLLLGTASEASAARPWWHLDTISAPAAPHTGVARIDLMAANLGDAPSMGTYEENVGKFLSGEHNGLITVTDKLPPGVTPTAAIAEGGGESLNVYGQLGLQEELEFFENAFGIKFPKLCTISGQTVECTYVMPVRPYEQILLEVTADVAPGAGQGENEFTVTGGGTATASARKPLAIEAPAPGYGVQTYEVTPEEEGGTLDTQAGSHPFQMTTTLLFNTWSDNVYLNPGQPYPPQFDPEVQPLAMTKDLRFNLPPGLVGNPTPLPKCPIHTFLAFFGSQGKIQCPDNTVVGVATPIFASFQPHGGNPRALSFPLFSLEPSAGEPAKFGFPTLAGPVVLDTSVRTGGDYGVVVTVPNITQTVGFIGDMVTFWGVPGDARHDASRNLKCLLPPEGGAPEATCPLKEKPQPLLIMPTSCTGPMHTTVEGDTWGNIGQFTSKEYTFQNPDGEPIGQDGCNQLNFEPTISVAPDGPNGSTPTGLTVGVHVPQEASLNPEGLAEAAVKDTTVTLPAGVALNPAGADGLLSCSLGQVGLESPAEQACPEAAKIGTVEIKTPLLPNPLVGAAYIAQQNANPFGSLLALYLVVHDRTSGVLVKIAGKVTPDLVTGQLTATFDDTPQLPFEDLELHFFGGSRAPLGTPALCGAYTTTAAIAPWSGSQEVHAASTFGITSGPNGASCSDPLPFAPTLHAGASNIQAGEFTPFSMTMSREDGSQNLDALTLHMPPGLSGTLRSVELCPEAQADAGTCGPASQIGETTISVGLGGNPYTVRGGKVFITGPYKGAPYGLSIVNPAKAGPFDVGQGACDCVVVRAKIEVDPTTAALTITSDAAGPYRIPTILDGIPLEIRHVNVTINRHDFTFNPTNCNKMAITGDLTSAEGAIDSLSLPFQVTNCATLGFKPHFTVSTSAHTSRTEGAELIARLTYPDAPFASQANVAKVRVELPKQLPSRLTTLQKACPDTVFDANPDSCPAASRVGEAIATTPIIPENFRGPAYFVSHGGAKFPELIIVLHGSALTVELHGETFISKAGVTSTTFSTVPDVPIGSFELRLPAGPDSALAANGDLCASKLVMPTTFTAQNGAVVEEATPIHVEGCAPEIRVVRHRVAGKTATIVVSVPSAGTLRAGGNGVSRVSKTVHRAGNVTVTLRLSKREQRFVARHHERRLMAPIRLSFSPSHGRRLTAQVAVLMR